MTSRPRALIRGLQLADDAYVALGEEVTVPDSGHVIVTLATWSALHERLQRASRLTVGVSVPNTTDLAQAWPLLADRPLIELNFPVFGDGRAYSQARLLRERYGYRGEIRATGAAVVADQAAQLLRCGFDAFVLREDQAPDAFIARLQQAQSTQWYQRPSERPLPSEARSTSPHSAGRIGAA